MNNDLSLVSVAIPARNDADHLPAAVASVLAQEVEHPIEVVIAVGPSEDDTEAVAEGLATNHPQVRVVPNPSGATAAGMNAAIRASHGEVVARVDSHSELSPGYLQRACELIQETGADNVGGIQKAVGTTPFQSAVAMAMTSRFGTGDAKFHYGGEAGPTDTVYLGVFRREALDRVGGFDESLVRNQDYELNVRIRESGGVVLFHPDLHVIYRPRSTLVGLAKQYFEYGRWKREVVRRHPRSVRWRQLVPPATVIGLATSLIAGLAIHPWLLAPAGGYLLAVGVATSIGAVKNGRGASSRLLLVYPVMHLSWGVGFLLGPPRRSISSTS